MPKEHDVRHVALLAADEHSGDKDKETSWSGPQSIGSCPFLTLHPSPLTSPQPLSLTAYR